MFRALTGNSHADVGGKDVAGMLRTVYGTTRRGEFAVDTREAAQHLGVSQRTVQRWLKNTHAPKPDHLKDIQTRSRQAVTTKRGRARAIKRATTGINAVARAKGASIKITGDQGPHGGGISGLRDTPTARYRSTSRNLNPVEYQQLLDAYAEGGDPAAQEFLQTIWSVKYVDGWTFNSIQSMNLGEYDPRLDNY
jgi:hypothetical protein